MSDTEGAFSYLQDTSLDERYDRWEKQVETVAIEMQQERTPDGKEFLNVSVHSMASAFHDAIDFLKKVNETKDEQEKA